MQLHRDALVFDRANALVKSRLSRFKAAAENLAGLQQSLGQTTTAADPTAAVIEAARTIDAAIVSGTLGAILEVFRNKLVKGKAALSFRKTIDEYITLAVAALKDTVVVNALAQILPSVPDVP